MSLENLNSNDGWHHFNFFLILYSRAIYFGASKFTTAFPRLVGALPGLVLTDQ
jgi:hypothetical protein